MSHSQTLYRGASIVALLGLMVQPLHGAESRLTLSPLVVTAPTMSSPLVIRTDTRAPRAPLPANDGAGFLQSIPGITASRKGGTGGDPVLRGLGGSRINLLMDDTRVFGGCGGRMDPPTAYIYPQAYDRVEVIKGPQTVRYGVTPAGQVRFERDRPRFRERVVEGFASGTVGSFGRNDVMADVTGGDRQGYVRLVGSLSRQDDYRDGDGDRVRSEYERWSTTTILGLTPDEKTRLEFAYDRSDAEAAYDDRGMDGTRFDRTGYTLRASRDDIGEHVARLEALLYYNDVDHVMDNFTLRSPPNMPMVRFPDRRTRGGRLATDLNVGELTTMHVGIDYSDDRHRDRRLMGMAALNWRNESREDTASFTQSGVFAELDHQLTRRTATVAGLRLDRHRATVEADDFGGASRGDRDSDDLWSGFLRVEHQLESLPLELQAGIGHARRAPDFWERDRVFDLDNEALTQLDLGAGFATENLQGSLAAFYGRIQDYVLVVAPGVEDREARNVNAETFGAEADLRWSLDHRFTLTGTVAWVYSRNRSDREPLAQTPPLETTLAVDYQEGRYFAGGLLRAVARQSRTHEGYGTIYSLDTRKTGSFATVALYGGVHLFDGARLTLGVDNLFDRAYAEHIQRGAAELGAAERQIKEPGRTLWATVGIDF